MDLHLIGDSLPNPSQIPLVPTVSGSIGISPYPAREDHSHASNTPWILATFSTGWADYGGVHTRVQYRKVGDKVEVMGLAVVTIARVAGDPVFVLPAGYRPVSLLLFVVLGWDGAGERGARLDVFSGGSVVPSNFAMPIGAYIALNFELSTL